MKLKNLLIQLEQSHVSYQRLALERDQLKQDLADLARENQALRCQLETRSLFTQLDLELDPACA